MRFNIDSFIQGTELHAYEYFGAHRATINHKRGYIFRVYAPNAKRVFLNCAINNWGATPLELQKVHHHGVFEIFVPGMKDYGYYKYSIQGPNGKFHDKMDPYEFYHELRPGSASSVYPSTKFKWSDKRWLNARDVCMDKPVSIYEVHLGSFRKPFDKEFYTYRELSERLVPYLLECGFTHVEFMPLTYHPFDGSWGYQSLGFYSIDSRCGTPDDLKYLINELHKNGIGVIFDYVPLHFATDAYGIINFDGTSLFEYSDDRKFSPWGSAQFDLGKDPVRSFLMSSMNYFFNEFHFDGVRIDAVSNIIFYNGDKTRGVNEGAHEFIKRFNSLIKIEHPDIMLIAEDSSDFYGVTKPLFDGGLGFDYKWDLGWMNDTLKYYASDTMFRGEKHGQLTFSMAYFYNENFVLPLSHDEVVHAKGTILNKMFGGYDDRFAQVRNLYVYQFLHPGKKLNFMGNELAVFDEFDPKRQFSPVFEMYPKHLGVRSLIKDLNFLYREEPALHINEYKHQNFFWLRLWAAHECVFVFERFYEDSHIICVLNMSPVDRPDYQIELRNRGSVREVINSQSEKYGGYVKENETNKSHKVYKATRDKDFPYAFNIHLRPFMAGVYKLTKKSKKD